MWHYLFFIVLVKVKDSTEYTGPESYVAEMIKVNKIKKTYHAYLFFFLVNEFQIVSDDAAFGVTVIRMLHEVGIE